MIRYSVLNIAFTILLPCNFEFEDYLILLLFEFTGLLVGWGNFAKDLRKIILTQDKKKFLIFLQTKLNKKIILF